MVDDESGEALIPGRITWSGIRPRELFAWTLASVAPDSKSGEYTLLAPLGRIGLSVDWDDYVDLQRSIDVVAGREDLELRVRRIPGAWLRLVDGDATVPIEWGWNVSIAPIDGAKDESALLSTEDANITAIENGRARIVAPAAGTYLVELPPIEGFDPVLPQVLRLGPGGDEELVVELVRKR